jgi:hypothetical protein
MPAAKAAAVSFINEQRQVARNIGRRYGQETFKFGIKGPSPARGRKSRKNRKTKRSRR